MARRSTPTTQVEITPGRRRFETETRYYETMLAEDLWSTPVLTTSWGSKSSNLGKTRVVAIGEEKCKETLKQVVRRRQLRGYREITTTGTQIK